MSVDLFVRGFKSHLQDMDWSEAMKLEYDAPSKYTRFGFRRYFLS